jgi:hypothetical protein
MEGETADKILVAIVGVVGFMAMFYVLATDENPVEFNKGMEDGYNEHNITKYTAADKITDCVGVGYTEKQYAYSLGYRSGFLRYAEENRKREAAEERNETVKILGV